MKSIGDLLAAAFSPGPEPAARPTKLIEDKDTAFWTTTKGAPTNMSTMTKATLNAIIDSVENDPLAGRGSLTKKDILIDRLLAHFNTVETAPRTMPIAAPILTDPKATVTITKPGATTQAKVGA